jgi:hypothetical protein
MLREYTWDSQKQKLQHYKRRQPETSVLYQIVYHARDDLECQWDKRFQHQYGVLRDEVTKTLDEYRSAELTSKPQLRNPRPRRCQGLLRQLQTLTSRSILLQATRCMPILQR